MFLQLLRSNKNREQKQGDAGGEGRTGARQPPPHGEKLQRRQNDEALQVINRCRMKMGVSSGSS